MLARLSAVAVLVIAFAGEANAQQPGGWGTPPPGGTQPGGWGTPPPGETQPGGWGTPPPGGTQPGGWGAPPPTEPMPPPPGSFPETLPPGEAPAADDGFANIGLGFSNHFAPVFNTASPMSGTLDIVGTVPGDIAAAAVSPYYANLSMRYRLNPSHEIEVLLGMAYLKMTAQAGSVAPAPPNEEIALDGFLMHLGGRYLYTIAGNDRARLYTGGGLAFAVGTLLGDGDDPAHTHGWDEILYWGIMIGAPLGFEYRFEGAPQLALTIEVGIGITYIGVNTAHKPGLAGGPGAPTIEDSGGMFLFGMGQAAALDDQVYLPLIDHVSFGLHYYF